MMLLLDVKIQEPTKSKYWIIGRQFFSRKPVHLSLTLFVKFIKKSWKQEFSLLCGQRQSLLVCSKQDTSPKLITINPYHYSTFVENVLKPGYFGYSDDIKLVGLNSGC